MRVLPKRPRALLLLGAFLLLTVPAAPARGALPAPDAAAGAFASPLFERVWSRTDAPVAAGVAHRSWTWGPTAGPSLNEPFAGAPGGARPVQYFDKGRMEVNPAVQDPASPWAATSGLLVVELVSGRLQTGPDQFADRAPAEVPVAGEPPAPDDGSVPTYASFAGVASLPGGPDRHAAKNRDLVLATISRAGLGALLPAKRGVEVRNAGYSPETGHNIPDVFWSFMQAQGFVAAGSGYQQRQLFDPVFVLGYPITEAYWSTAIIGGKRVPVLIQLFQRRVLTYVPTFATPWQVQMGNVGQQYYLWRYGQVMPPGAAIAVPPGPAPPPPAAFVHPQGGQLVVNGVPILLKGTNYWLHTAPFVPMWSNWDAPTIAAELGKARDLGANSVRVGVPYNTIPLDLVWGDKLSERVNGPIVNLMTQFLEIAASYNMKVMFELFDGTDRVEEAQGPEWRKELNYVQGMVEPFASDDRVLAWDLHNEPDNNIVWKKGGAARAITWLAEMAGAVRAYDTNHPITVGMGQYDNLWAAPAGKRVLDFVDFVSFHDYDAGHIADQIAAVQAHTTLPIVLSEMGWPTGPAGESTPAATYDEATQQRLYQAMLPAARAAGLAGVMQWTLWDYDPVRQPRHNHEAYFGLVRTDGSFKPAAALFRDLYPAFPLPSLTTTGPHLTGYGQHVDIGP